MTNMSANASLPDMWEKALAAFEKDLFRRERSEKTVTIYGSCLQHFAFFCRRELQKPGPYVACNLSASNSSSSYSQTYKGDSSPTPITVTSSSEDGGDGGGGCFINITIP
jgi:hypothetical protein